MCVPQIAFLDSHSAPKASDLTNAAAGAGAATTTRTLPRTIELLIISIFINAHVVVGEGEGCEGREGEGDGGNFLRRSMDVVWPPNFCVLRKSSSHPRLC